MYSTNPEDAASVGEVIEIASAAWPGARAQIEAEPDGPREAPWLKLDNRLAREALGIEPRWTLAEAVQRSMQWYQAIAGGEAARALCNADIDRFEQARA